MNMEKKILNKLRNVQFLVSRQHYNIPIPQDMIAEDGDWLAITSTDWDFLTPEMIQQHGKKIKGIFALDDATVVMAIECGLPYILWEDFLNLDKFEITHQCLLDSLKLWYKELENYYTDENGIVWPEVDNQALQWFWTDIAFMQCFEEKLIQNDMSLIVVHHDPFVPALYYLSKDNFGRMCTELQNTRISSITIHSKSITNTNNRHINIIPKANVKGKVFCALQAGELYRSRHIISALQEKYTNNFALATLTPYKNNEFEGVPIIPAFYQGNKHEPAFFDEAWKHLRKTTTIFPKKLRFYILKTLYWYHTQRWPSLKHHAEILVDYFKTSPPACVVGSNLMDAESQIAIIAANLLQIPTLSWGHAYTGNFRGWHSFCAKKVLITTKLDFENTLQLKISESTISPVKDIALKSLLPPQRKTMPYFKTDKLRVLILAPSAKLNGQATAFSNLRLEAQYLHELTNPPQDLKDNIEQKIKGHPWLSDRAPYFMMGIDEEIYAIPKGVDLHEVISECDCCISVNYDTCGFYFCAVQRPTALILDDKMFKSIDTHRVVTNSMYNNLCSNMENIWDFLRYILNYPEKHEEIVEKQKHSLTFKNNESKDWLDVVHEQFLLGSNKQ